MPRTPRTVPRTPRTVPRTPRCLALYKDPISRYRNLPPSAIGDTSPNGSYILATLLRIPHFVGSVLSDGKLTRMVSLSLFHCRPSREAPSFLEVPNCSFACFFFWGWYWACCLQLLHVWVPLVQLKCPFSKYLHWCWLDGFCLCLSGPSTDKIIYIKASLNLTNNLWVLLSAALQEMLYNSPREEMVSRWGQRGLW